MPALPSELRKKLEKFVANLSLLTRSRSYSLKDGPMVIGQKEKRPA